jgi:hypothetical protein
VEKYICESGRRKPAEEAHLDALVDELDHAGESRRSSAYHTNLLAAPHRRDLVEDELTEALVASMLDRRVTRVEKKEMRFD